MNNKRTSFNFEEVINLDIVEQASNSGKSLKYKNLEKVSADSGFIKSLSQTRKNKRKRSPYTEQLGIKVRPLIKDIFQELGEK